MRLIVRWLSNVVALFVAAWAFSGITYGDGWWTLIVAGLVFSLVNMLVRPVVTLLSLPLIILTLGVALFFVNLLMLYLTAWLVDGFAIDGFWTAVGGTVVVWLVNLVLSPLLDRRGRRRSRSRSER